MRKTSTQWNFCSTDAHVLISLAEQPDIRLREVAERVGITERAVQSIVSDLERLGAITRVREGRRNRYIIHGDVEFQHPVESGWTIADLVALVESRRQRLAANPMEAKQPTTAELEGESLT